MRPFAKLPGSILRVYVCLTFLASRNAPYAELHEHIFHGAAISCILAELISELFNELGISSDSLNVYAGTLMTYMAVRAMLTNDMINCHCS